MSRLLHLAVVGVVCAAAAGGTAMTASNTGVSAGTAGFGSVTISGAVLNSVDFTQSADGTQITDAALVIDANMTGKTVKAGFGTTASTTCAVGTYDATATETPVTCTGYTQSISAASQFNVSVTE